MILLKLKPYSFPSNAGHPIRKQGKILRIAVRIALDIWALMLIAIYPIILYFIYIFSHIFSYVEDPLLIKMSRKPDFLTRVGLVYFVSIICWWVLQLMPYIVEWVKRTRTLAQRLTIVEAESALIHDARAPILYLRSFLDRYTGNDIWAQTKSDENLIFPILKEVGAVIAIGQPGETLPPLGAARLYLDNDCNWQTSVTDYFSRSKLVIISPSYSDGVIWEASKAFQLCPPEKIIISLISFKPELNYSKKHDEYKLFRNAIKINTKIKLPEDIGESFFIYFDSNWNPQLAKSDVNRLSSWFIEATVRNALQKPLHIIGAAFSLDFISNWNPQLAKSDADRFIEVAVRDALQRLLHTKGINVRRKMPLGWYLSNIYQLIIVYVALLIPIVTVIRMFLEWLY